MRGIPIPILASSNIALMGGAVAITPALVQYAEQTVADGSQAAVAQVLTNTIDVPTTITGSGNVNLEVRAKGFNGGVPLVIPQPLLEDDDATLAAARIGDSHGALHDDPTFAAFFTASHVGDDVIITFNNPANNDPWALFTITPTTATGINASSSTITTPGNAAGCQADFMNCLVSGDAVSRKERIHYADVPASLAHTLTVAGIVVTYQQIDDLYGPLNSVGDWASATADYINTDPNSQGFAAAEVASAAYISGGDLDVTMLTGSAYNSLTFASSDVNVGCADWLKCTGAGTDAVNVADYRPLTWDVFDGVLRCTQQISVGSPFPSLVAADGVWYLTDADGNDNLYYFTWPTSAYVNPTSLAPADWTEINGGVAPGPQFAQLGADAFTNNVTWLFQLQYDAMPNGRNYYKFGNNQIIWNGLMWTCYDYNLDENVYEGTLDVAYPWQDVWVKTSFGSDPVPTFSNPTVTAGDQVFIGISYDSSATIDTAVFVGGGAGTLTLIGGTAVTGTGMKIAIYRGTATGGETGVQFITDSAVRCSIQAMEFSGVSSAAAQDTDSNSGNDATMSFNAVTPSSARNVVLGIAAYANATDAYSSGPSGPFTRFGGVGGDGIFQEVVYTIQESATAQGSNMNVVLTGAKDFVTANAVIGGA